MPNNEHMPNDLRDALDDVLKGEYENFRTYLNDHKVTTLNLSPYERAIRPNQVSHLGKSLEGTRVISVICKGGMHSPNAETFCQSLKNTGVQSIDLKGNYIPSLMALKEALVDSKVTSLNGIDIDKLQKLSGKKFKYNPNSDSNAFLAFLMGPITAGISNTLGLTLLSSRAIAGSVAACTTYAVMFCRSKLIDYCDKKVDSGQWAFNDSNEYEAYLAGLNSDNWSGYAKSFLKPSAYLFLPYYAGLAKMHKETFDLCKGDSRLRMQMRQY